MTGEPTGTDVTGLIEHSRASIDALRREIRGRSGTALIDFIIGDFAELKRILSDPRSHQAIMAGMAALQWLNEQLGRSRLAFADLLQW